MWAAEFPISNWVISFFSNSSSICSSFSTLLFQSSLIYSHNDSRNQTDPQNNFVLPETFMYTFIYICMYLCLYKISSLCLSLGRLTLFADSHRGIGCQYHAHNIWRVPTLGRVETMSQSGVRALRSPSVLFSLTPLRLNYTPDARGWDGEYQWFQTSAITTFGYSLWPGLKCSIVYWDWLL